MVFREKLRKVMSRSSNDTDRSSTSSSGSRKNSNMYQPGEAIPYKYRRPVAKEHKDKLEAFSFANAWRRKSCQSQYSPMGSRAVSRRNSAASQLRRGLAMRHHGSLGGVDAEDAAMPPAAITDLAGSADQTYQHDSSDFGADYADAADSPTQSSSSQHDQPFSHEELELALKNSHLAVPAQE